MQPPQLGGASQQSQPSSQQSFSMSQSSQSVYRQYTDPPNRLHNDHAVPTIYSATYSGVGVYEMEVNNVAVMRRQKDGWVNATQILKVANIDKGRRTKILEKEIQIGEHEKVQGGYGKYQGTWIPFERGLEVCRQYGVEELLSKLLTHNRGQEGETGNVDTPTKEQAMAAQRKRMYNASSQENRGIGSTGTFFKNISSTASTAVAAISKARFDSPAPRNRSGPSRAPSFNRQSSMQDVADFPNSQQSLVSAETQNADSGFGSQNTQPLTGDGLEQPPRKRQRVLTPARSFGGQTPGYQPVDPYNAGNVGNGDPGSPTEPNNSFVYEQVTANDGEASYALGPLRPLPYDNNADAEAKRGMLMGLFMDANGPDEAIQAALCNVPPQKLDSPIDTQSHTALHWAATLSRMPLLRALINAGANPWRVNACGETALMRACTVTNSMENNTFPELLDLLGCTLDVTDDKGRTVLHHIAVTSAVKGRHYASRYYLESLLEWVVRQGSAPSSQENGVGDRKGRRMGIGRFMSEIVNAQDNSGDTALNVAARVGNRSIISQLLEVGADPTIPNRANLKPLDFGIGIADAETNGDQPGEKNGATAGSGHKSRETSDEVVNSITHLIGESTSIFQNELKKKQESIDTLHSQLRITSSQVGDARRTLESLQEKLQAQQLAKQKIVNFNRASEEEEQILIELEQRHGRLDVASANAWEMELESALEIVKTQSPKGLDPDSRPSLPSVAVLSARIKALRARSTKTQQAVAALQAQSKEKELKYRRLVSLCTRRPEIEVEALLDTLTRAVESEKPELEIARVRRFLGGVEGVVH
ncbi:transcriptional regulator swi6 [Neurospora sp. IMI 360204]|nr:transcriptional regulator swi6 [Neurospora sp. IMI 360204]